VSRAEHWLLLTAFVALPAASQAQSPKDLTKDLVQHAVTTELADDAADHSHWLYFDIDRKPENAVKQWVADAKGGSLHLIVERNGQPVPKDEQRRKMDEFIRDTDAQARQRKNGAHDDDQAAEMLRLLPQAFIWTEVGKKGSLTTLHFKPDPEFHAPDWEARVFAAMEGDLVVENQQLRIVSLKGRLIHDVLFLGGLLGRLQSGGTFAVERRELSTGIWQITETHVHITGHALLFKDISEEEDESKNSFTRLPAELDLQQAEKEILDKVGNRENASN
jgi:hypothetical protein